MARAPVASEAFSSFTSRARERGQLPFQPRHVSFDAGGVDDQQILQGRKVISVKVINDAAALVAHQRVLALSAREFANVVGQHPVKKPLGARAGDADLAHVRDVEEAGGVPHGQVLVNDAGVLHRHFPAAEFNELAA